MEEIHMMPTYELQKAQLFIEQAFKIIAQLKRELQQKETAESIREYENDPEIWTVVHTR
jgi:hypothetical protein